MATHLKNIKRHLISSKLSLLLSLPPPYLIDPMPHSCNSVKRF